MSDLARATGELEAATEALAAAVAGGDEAAVADALAQRERALAPLRDAPPESLGSALRERLARVAAIDRELLATAEEARRRIASELAELRRARGASRALRPPVDPAPRFVSRRV